MRKRVYIDISNLYITRSITGIQRVVRSLVPHFVADADLEVLFLFFDVTRNCFAVLDNKDVLVLAESLGKEQINPVREISVADMARDDIFLDIDSVWNNALKRSGLYPKLKCNGVKIGTYLYDLVPIIKPAHAHPNTLRNYTMFVAAALTYSDFILTDSRSTERDLQELLEKMCVDRYIPTVVTRLGGSFDVKTSGPSENKIPRKLLRRKYLLFVGTLEPRKKQKLLLDAFLGIQKVHPEVDLVYVGKPGWDNGPFLEELSSQVSRNSHIHWFTGLDDRDLEKLYSSCFLSVYLSEYEGYGLPIAEALERGKPIIASRNSSMHEVGLDFADYISYGSKSELVGIIDLYISEKKFYELKLKRIKEYYKPISWAYVFRNIKNMLNPKSIDSCVAVCSESANRIQHVSISIRPEDFERCVRLTDRHVGFVKEYVVITRPDLVQRYQSIPSNHKIVVVSESDVLGDLYESFLTYPHAKKNWLLRSSLPGLDVIDQDFVMMDDDNLPIKKIETDYFVEKGIFKAYFYTDLLSWDYTSNSFDAAERHAGEIAYENNLEMLSYASHSPQIINKKILKEATEMFNGSGPNREIGEWSAYFNYAVTNYPTRFKKLKYETLNWPAHPNDWQVLYKPDRYSYENYYDYTYSDQGIFKGMKINSGLKDKIRLKKDQGLRSIYSKEYMESAVRLSSVNDMIHGVMYFYGRGNESEVALLLGVPYLLAGTSHTVNWVKVSFKVVNPKRGSKYTLVVQNSIGSTRSVDLVSHTSYRCGGLIEGVVEMPIHFHLKGVKPVNYTIKRDGIDMHTRNGRYDSVAFNYEGEDIRDSLERMPKEELRGAIGDL